MDIVSVIGGVAANQIVELFKGPREQIAAILSSSLLQYRLKQDIKVLAKAQELVRTHNISIKALNLKVLAPLLENAILEDEPVLQELWANLIANTVDSSKAYETVIFTQLLKDITTEEARLLLYLNNEGKTQNQKIFSSFPNLQPYMIINLKRLGLIDVQNTPDWESGRIVLKAGGAYMSDKETDERTKDLYLFGEALFHKEYHQFITPLGKEFIRAVTLAI